MQWGKQLATRELPSSSAWAREANQLCPPVSALYPAETFLSTESGCLHCLPRYANSSTRPGQQKQHCAIWGDRQADIPGITAS